MTANQLAKQLVVVDGPSSMNQNQHFQKVLLWNADGTPLVADQTGMVPAATQATFAGADITALKVELNAFLTKLKDAGIVLSS
jgi:hypothetical protein